MSVMAGDARQTGAEAERPMLASTWRAMSWPTPPSTSRHLLADARPGAAWRSPLGIPEPSEQLATAIEFLDELMQAAGPTFDSVLAAACEDRSGEPMLDALVRAVLRSTFEQFCSRQAVAPAGRQPK